MTVTIGRRELLAALGGAAAAWPLAARAQQAGKLPTIGFLGANTRLVDSQRLAAFVERLRELGWIENRTVAIEYSHRRLYARHGHRHSFAPCRNFW
jgi:putative ABC transport system substrate-binding protein